MFGLDLALPIDIFNVAWNDIIEYFTNDMTAAFTFLLKERIWSAFGFGAILFAMAFIAGISLLILMKDEYTHDWFVNVLLWDIKQIFKFYW